MFLVSLWCNLLLIEPQRHEGHREGEDQNIAHRMPNAERPMRMRSRQRPSAFDVGCSVFDVQVHGPEGTRRFP